MIKLPENCKTLIRLQRSGYKNIEKEFVEDIEKEFNDMLPFLPRKVKSVIDIGCGLGAIDILLSKHFKSPELFLLDKDEVSQDVVYGYSEKKSFYNSFDLLDDIMKLNQIKNYSIMDSGKEFPSVKADIILSLLACGFHFPIWYYLAKIWEHISDTGILIVDIRRTEEERQVNFIELYFEDVEEIKTKNPKTIRICASKPLQLEREEEIPWPE